MSRPKKWMCRDDQCSHEIKAATAKEAAQEWVDGGEWGEMDKTIWIEVGVAPIRRGKEIEKEREWFTIALHAEAPDCCEDRHSWKDTGMCGHGAGIIYTETCVHCGAKKITDTYATGPGGQQGYTSVRYERD